MISKEEIRKSIKLKKKNWNADNLNSASNMVFDRIEELDIFKSAINILMYYSLPDEVETHNRIARWHDMNKNIYLPCVSGNDIHIAHFDGALSPGAYNILEPSNCIYEPLGSMDFAIIPAVALSKTGQRIGRGKGYYDRLLSGSKVTKIGVIIEEQLVDTFFSEPHDINMDYVITERRIIQI